MNEIPPIIGVIDDDDSLRRALDALLRSVGYSSIGFASAEEFLSSHRLVSLGCLIVDLSLPGMNGLELQHRLGDTGTRVPMIFLTAHGSESRRAQALSAGAIAFLPKPFDTDVLLNAVRQAVT